MHGVKHAEHHGGGQPQPDLEAKQEQRRTNDEPLHGAVSGPFIAQPALQSTQPGPAADGADDDGEDDVGGCDDRVELAHGGGIVDRGEGEDQIDDGQHDGRADQVGDHQCGGQDGRDRAGELGARLLVGRRIQELRQQRPQAAGRRCHAQSAVRAGMMQ